jgi:hypothetical protein
MIGQEHSDYKPKTTNEAMVTSTRERTYHNHSSTKRPWCRRNVLTIMGMIGMLALIVLIPWSTIPYRDGNRSKQEDIDDGRNRLYYTCDDIFETKIELLSPDVLHGYYNQDDLEKSVEQAAYYLIGRKFDQWKDISNGLDNDRPDKLIGYDEISNMSFSNSTVNTSSSSTMNNNSNIPLNNMDDDDDDFNVADAIEIDSEFDIFKDALYNPDMDKSIYGNTIVTDGEVGTCRSLQ